MDLYTLLGGLSALSLLYLRLYPFIFSPSPKNPTNTITTDNVSTALRLYAAYLTPLTPYLAPLRPFLLQSYAFYIANIHPAVAVLQTTLLALSTTLLSKLFSFLAGAPPAASFATAIALLIGVLYLYLRITALVRRLTFYLIGWAVSLGFWAGVVGVAYYVYQRGVEQALQDLGWVVGVLGEWWSVARQEGQREGKAWEGRARYEDESRRVVREWARRGGAGGVGGNGAGGGGWGW